MKSTTKQNTKETRLKQALKLISNHPGFEMATIGNHANEVYGIAIIGHLGIQIDISEVGNMEVFRVQLAARMAMPPILAAFDLANQINILLRVAKLNVANDGFIIKAHQFVEINCLPTETNILHLIDEVLVGIKLLVNHLKQLDAKLVAQDAANLKTNVCLN